MLVCESYRVGRVAAEDVVELRPVVGGRHQHPVLPVDKEILADCRKGESGQEGVYVVLHLYHYVLIYSWR